MKTTKEAKKLFVKLSTVHALLSDLANELLPEEVAAGKIDVRSEAEGYEDRGTQSFSVFITFQEDNKWCTILEVCVFKRYDKDLYNKGLLDVSKACATNWEDDSMKRLSFMKMKAALIAYRLKARVEQMLNA